MLALALSQFTFFISSSPQSYPLLFPAAAPKLKPAPQPKAAAKKSYKIEESDEDTDFEAEDDDSDFDEPKRKAARYAVTWLVLSAHSMFSMNDVMR